MFRKPQRRFTKDHPEYAAHSIGDHTYGTPQVLSWGEGARLRIGKFCSIAQEVMIFLGGEHRTDWVSTYPFSMFFDDVRQVPGHPKTKGDVTIGNDVWIGARAVILSGVSIGDGAVIGAGSIVTGDVAPYAIVAGNPARLIRMRFDAPTIERLVKLRWWDWSPEKIKKNLPLLFSDRVRELLDQNS